MKDRPRGWNSTLPRATKPMNRGKGLSPGKGLKPGGRLKVHDFRNRKEGRHGPLWEAVRRLPCFLAVLAPELHPMCGLGYASGHTAHHVIPASLDIMGLLPCCGQVHDVLERFKRQEVVDFISILGVKFEVEVIPLGLIYVAQVDLESVELEI